MDFFDYGHSVVDLVNPQFAVNAWHDIDKDELVRRLDKIDDKPWVPLNPPQTPNFAAFVNVIDETTWKCWERYGKTHIKPKIMEQHLALFRPTQQRNTTVLEAPSVEEHIWIMAPLNTLHPQLGFTLMESSHRSLKNGPDKPYSPEVLPGQALMFNTQLRKTNPTIGGAVVWARLYDMRGL